MAALTVQNISQTSLVPSLVQAAAGGDHFIADNGQRHFLMVLNGSGAPITVTIPAQQATSQQQGVGQVAVDNIAVAVAAGAQAMIGPITDAYIRGNDGAVEITYSGVTDLDVGAIRLPRVAS